MEDWKPLFSATLNPILSTYQDSNGHTISCKARTEMIELAYSRFGSLLAEYGLEIKPTTDSTGNTTGRIN